MGCACYPISFSQPPCAPCCNTLQGPAGLSAYDLAVQYNGFTGTVVEWLASLRGATGAAPAATASTEITLSAFRLLTPAEQASRLWVIMPDPT